MKTVMLKIWRPLILWMGLTILSGPVFGQDQDPFDGADSPSPELLEELESLMENPIDINQANENDLLRIPVMTSGLADRIVVERKTNGPFRSIDDFRKRLGLKTKQLNRMKPYIRFEDHAIKVFSRSREIRRFIEKDDETEIRFYQKVKVEYEPARSEIVFQDQTGEEQILRGFAQAAGRNWGVVIGDFIMEAGQGLVFWIPFGWTKGSDPVSPAFKRGKGVKGCAYPSSEPLRGGAVSITKFGLGLRAFKAETVDKIPVVGGRANYAWGKGEIGIGGWRDKTGAGTEGADCRWAFGPYVTAWEFARSMNGGIGYVGILKAELARLDWVASVRKFDPDFDNPMSHSFTGRTRNERGFYWGVSAEPFRGTRIGTFYDMHRSMEPDRTHQMPFGGNDAFIEWDQTLRSWLEWTVRFRLRHEDVKEEIPGERFPIEVMARNRHRLIRFELRTKPARWIKLKSRFETVRTDEMLTGLGSVGELQSGFMLFQDMRIDAKNFALCIRFVAYESDGWDSRLYELENDLPGVMTLKPLYGRGQRTYAVLKWRIGGIADLSAKYAESIDIETKIRGREFGMGLDLRWPGK